MQYNDTHASGKRSKIDSIFFTGFSAKNLPPSSSPQRTGNQTIKEFYQEEGPFNMTFSRYRLFLIGDGRPLLPPSDKNSLITISICGRPLILLYVNV